MNAKYAHLAINAHKSASRNWFKQTMKLDVSVMTIDAIVAIHYESLNAIAINFVDANEINFNNFVVSSVNINVKEVLSVDITIYDNVDTRIKFVNVTIKSSHTRRVRISWLEEISAFAESRHELISRTLSSR